MTRSLRFALPLLALAALTARAAGPTKEEAPKIKEFETAPLWPDRDHPTAWYGRFGMTNCAWIDMGDGVLVFDTGGTAADAVNLRNEIKRTTKGKPIRWIVLSHLHPTANGGLPSLLPAPVTLFVNQSVATGIALGVEKKSAPGKHVTVVGVTDRLFLLFGKHPLELFVPRGAAHSEHDLVAFAPEMGTAFVGDLVTTGRCPVMADPAANPSVWMETLDRILALKPAVLIPSSGDAAVRPDPNVATGGLDLDNEVKVTRAYVNRLLDALKDLRKRDAPETQVASELRTLSGTGSYCPNQLDSVNALALYRRMNKEGDLVPASTLKPSPAPAGSGK
jgi:glyoxylase-like metal-dependent hydrolase (beta-lactamase superfamily II)